MFTASTVGRWCEIQSLSSPKLQSKNSLVSEPSPAISGITLSVGAGRLQEASRRVDASEFGNRESGEADTDDAGKSSVAALVVCARSPELGDATGVEAMDWFEGDTTVEAIGASTETASATGVDAGEQLWIHDYGCDEDGGYVGSLLAGRQR